MEPESAAPPLPFVQRPHILVIDDDARLRDVLCRYLAHQDCIPCQADSAASARALLPVFPPDLIVLDVMMPVEDGITLLQSGSLAGIPVLLLTARGSAEDRITGLEAGADDYLAKPFEPRELLLRIHAILRRNKPAAAPQNLKFGQWRYDISQNTVTDDTGTPLKLTEIELALLKIMAEHGGRVLSREKLAEQLGRSELNGRSIDVHITRLRKKLADDSRQPRFLLTVRGEGYLLRCSP